MFPRLPGPIGADIFLGATTTVRTVFPNSRLDSLSGGGGGSGSSSSAQNAHHHQQHHNHQQHSHDASSSSSSSFSASATPSPAFGNQLLSPFDPANNNDFAATASMNAAAADGSSLSISSSFSPLDDGAASNNYLPEDDADWWSNAIEEDTFESPLAFDASENGLWNGRFVPPPPRPPFLDDGVAADGLTTCDLCTWAWQRNAYSLDGSIDHAGELGWAFTLIIVSIISALIGAIVMVIVLRCRRIKSANGNAGRTQPWWCRNNRNGGSNGRSTLSIKHPADSIRRRPNSNSGVWSWSRRSSASPDQIGPPSSSPAENHYTHMDDAYSPVNEALYAELDRESKYNFQQHEQDIPMVVSSAPSSAYYSDLSVTGMPGGGNERAYEIVGLTVMSQPLPNWDGSGGGGGGGVGGSSGVLGIGVGGTMGMGLGSVGGGPNEASQRRIPRLAAINETSTSTVVATVPSDYV
ncbi:PREDICTED: uncharacterized protein LOC108359503 isoform X2 [Rhagoletis zephyria]|uniref:uncharacterized protein LOC108359503 isoform X2 n=1 Tax=Rhagoletis zephyria TaxID=28612 RepID=UPI000811652F|nr:PREDICTED: uncharacterized protein LOC108359503 isoform X2 [Rhagoletis zephyria]